jgi:hypothetical protein
MCRRIPNLETAIEECRQLGKMFKYKYTGSKHIKFYVEDKMIMIGLKKSNPDKVRKDIRRVINV